ncbi:TRAP transporter small permease [Microbacterium album]|uniref:Tripartite ATP-independent periplasmic transporters DctQ component domain-containing protein n=1 Tax=Microbacterium album TaxID=2053191 RepID=A0A917IHK2_9MICO|nr:TRAP transporter small permease [Microbacterium album]GGH44786.1 hypothetical protein GCM10010921_19700 [Microbacterium album]
MEAVVKGVSRVLGIVAAFAVVVLMVAIVIDVVFRRLTGRSLPSMVEVAETSLVAAIFLGLAWALVTGAHVAVTLLTDRLGPRANRVLGVVAWILCTGIGVWFTIGTGLRAMTSTGLGETRMGLVMWPLWPLRWIIVVGFAVLTAACVLNLVRALRGRELLGDTTVRPELGGVDEVDAPAPASAEKGA